MMMMMIIIITVITVADITANVIFEKLDFFLLPCCTVPKYLNLHITMSQACQANDAMRILYTTFNLILVGVVCD